MHNLLDALSKDFDVLIFDSAPVLAVADAAILGTMSDGVLLVIRAGRTERDEAQAALDQLSTVGARVAGVVLNDPDDKVPQYGSYYRYEYYTEKV